MSEIRVIVGLGNPGREYENTRHNAGFEVVDLLAEKLGVKVKKKKFGGLFGEAEFEGKKLILLKPQSYMNRSGQAVATVKGFYRFENSDLMIVSDDMALEPGSIRLRAKGSAGGHNGLLDIIEKLGTSDFARLRIGIGQNEFADARNYVLGRMSAGQRSVIDEAKEKACQALFCWLEAGIDLAMNKFNVKNVDKNEE